MTRDEIRAACACARGVPPFVPFRVVYTTERFDTEQHAATAARFALTSARGGRVAFYTWPRYMRVDYREGFGPVIVCAAWCWSVANVGYFADNEYVRFYPAQEETK